MDDTDSRRFFSALTFMAEMCADELSELKQRGYWSLLQDKLSIEEWEYGCMQAMERETFHKIPMPAVLLDYGREYRHARRAQREQAARQTKRLMAPEESLHTVRALIASVWPDDRLKDPIPPYEETP